MHAQIYRVYSNNQEYEIFRLQDPLQNVPNETRMIVRLGRALLPGEFRIKLSLLHVNEVEVSSHVPALWLASQGIVRIGCTLTCSVCERWTLVDCDVIIHLFFFSFSSLC